MCRLMLTVLPILLALPSCGGRVTPPTVPLPANLSAPCVAIPPLPEPFVGAARDEWEAALILLYGECAARHRETVRAWPN